MSTTKKNTTVALHDAFRKQYPHIPVRLLPLLEEVMSYSNCEDMAASIERLYELSLFRAGAHEGLDTNDCNTLVDAHHLMKAFRKAATIPVDPLRAGQ